MELQTLPDKPEAKQTEVGSVRQFFKTPTATLNQLELHVTTLNPGKSPHPPHKHPNEELIIIREGTVETLSGGEWKRVGPGSGETVVRGSMDDGSFTVFYLGDDGAVKAALTVGRSDDLEHARRFLKEGTAPDRQELADEGTDLASL